MFRKVQSEHFYHELNEPTKMMTGFTLFSQNWYNIKKIQSFITLSSQQYSLRLKLEADTHSKTQNKFASIIVLKLFISGF